jgi:hypothetical protein
MAFQITALSASTSEKVLVLASFVSRQKQATPAKRGAKNAITYSKMSVVGLKPQGPLLAGSFTALSVTRLGFNSID